MPEAVAQQRRAVRFEPQFARIPVDQIGGGRVIRPFRLGDQHIKAGTILDKETIRSWPAANRRELLDRFVLVWPQAPDVGSASTTKGRVEQAERHIVSLGFKRYNVIEGVQLNEKPVTRDEAYALAGKPVPPTE